MRIGMIVASLSRIGGGVSQAVQELTRALVRNGIEVEVFAGVDDFSDVDQSDWEASAIHTLPVVGPSAFGYQPSLLRALSAKPLDCIHLHGLWMYGSIVSHQMVRRGLPLIISPHGMLDAWALRNSAVKKRVAWKMFERRNMQSATVLHALNSAEARGFHAIGLKNKTEILPNGVSIEAFERQASVAEWESKIPKGTRRLLFLGRLHPKKGLSELIEGFSLVASRSEMLRWHLIIAGWDDGGHLDSLKLLVQKHNLNDRIHFIGPVFGQVKCRALQTADGFILPSFSEGLPIAVLEAWAAGAPTIITSHCNLNIAFLNRAALQVLPEPTSIAEGCLTLATMPNHELIKMTNQAKQLIISQFSWNNISLKMTSVYQNAIEAEGV